MHAAVLNRCANKKRTFIMHKTLLLAAALAAALAAGTAGAAEIEVKMLNKGEKGAMVFEPDLIRAAPGDVIHFVPTDKSHNAESIKGMLPEGVQPFKSKINEAYKLTVEKEGIYGVKCTPHYAMGMVALIIAGEPNPQALEEAAAVKHPGKAKERFAAIFEEVAASN
jgi:pseudoazurin